MYKKLLGLVFAGALLVGAMLPGAALAGHGNGNANDNSHDRPSSRVEVCHKDRTISVGEKAAAAHLLAHGDDVAGACAP